MCESENEEKGRQSDISKGCCFYAYVAELLGIIALSCWSCPARFRLNPSILLSISLDVEHLAMDSEKRLLCIWEITSSLFAHAVLTGIFFGFGRIWKLRLVFGEFPWTSITTYKRKTWHRVQASCILVWIVEHFWDRYRFSLVYVCQTWFQFQVSMRLRPSGWQSLNCCVFGVEGFCWWHCYAIAFAGCPWKQLAKFSFVVTVWLVVI